MKHQIQNETVQVMHHAGTKLNLEHVGGAVNNPKGMTNNNQKTHKKFVVQ
jgi:hypothetical protein